MSNTIQQIVDYINTLHDDVLVFNKRNSRYGAKANCSVRYKDTEALFDVNNSTVIVYTSTSNMSIIHANGIIIADFVKDIEVYTRII